MALATITTKGQVTIPKKIRESLKLNTGDKIEIIVTDKMEAVIRPVSKTVDELFCKLYTPDQKAISVEEINNAISNRIKSKHR